MEVPLWTAYGQNGRCGMQPKAKHKSSRAGAAKTRTETCEIVEEKQKLLDIRAEKERSSEGERERCASRQSKVKKRFSSVRKIVKIEDQHLKTMRERKDQKSEENSPSTSDKSKTPEVSSADSKNELVISLFEFTKPNPGRSDRIDCEGLGFVLGERNLRTCSSLILRENIPTRSELKGSEHMLKRPYSYFSEAGPSHNNILPARWHENLSAVNMEGVFAKGGHKTEKKVYGSPAVKVSDYGRHVMSSSPVPLKTRRERCTLNLSRAQTSSVGMVW
ncbi:uncharacterized protein TNCV_523161 [Trichonephila clavipes]|nr:uncharacterized protein TNCV_523161 [Trichonephila clavipes]